MGATTIPKIPPLPPVKGKPVSSSPPAGVPGKKPVPTPTPPGDIIPVFMDVETAKYLVRALTAAISGATQPVKKKSKK